MGTKDEPLAVAFGKQLRELRLAAGLSQSELGERVSPPMQIQAIARYESGSRGPTLAIIYRLAAAIGVEPSALLPVAASKKPVKGKSK